MNHRIKEVRTAFGLSQVKFAERMAISPSYLAEIESNKKIASERVIKLLAVEFNVDYNWLRTGEGLMFKTDIDVQLAKIISVFKSLDQQFKLCALSQLEELANLYDRL